MSAPLVTLFFLFLHYHTCVKSLAYSVIVVVRFLFLLHHRKVKEMFCKCRFGQISGEDWESLGNWTFQIEDKGVRGLKWKSWNNTSIFLCRRKFKKSDFGKVTAVWHCNMAIVTNKQLFKCQSNFSKMIGLPVSSPKSLQFLSFR